MMFLVSQLAVRIHFLDLGFPHSLWVAAPSPGHFLPFLHCQRSEEKKLLEEKQRGINKNVFPLPFPLPSIQAWQLWKGSSLEVRLFLYCLCSSRLRNKGGIKPQETRLFEWEPEYTRLNISKEADFTRSCNFSKDTYADTPPPPSVSRDRSSPSQDQGRSFSCTPPSAELEWKLRCRMEGAQLKAGVPQRRVSEHLPQPVPVSISTHAWAMGLMSDREGFGQI